MNSNSLPSVLMLAMGLISSAVAASAPGGSFKAGEYEAAKAKAIETGKPIAIVITELKSSCPKCQAGNEAVFRQMRSDFVLVIDDKTQKGRLPTNVKQNTYPIYKSKGNIIPIVAVLSPQTDKLLGGLSYKQISADGRNAFKTLKQEVSKAKEEEVLPTPAPAAATTSANVKANAKSSMREWTNTEGVTIKAEAIASNDTSVTLKLENGKVIDYPLEKLSEESRELVNGIAPSN